jgi:hypothetical protein
VPAPGADIPADCVLGEWLLRVREWLAKFPFDTVVRARRTPHLPL